MMRDGRRVVYSHEYMLCMLRTLEARASAAVSVVQHNAALMAELADLRDELHELREIMLLVTSTLRQQAECDVAQLRRQLELALARLERDPRRPLH